MLMRLALDLFCTGLCCTVPLLLIMAATKVCRDVLQAPFKSCEGMAYNWFLVCFAGISGLLYDLASLAADVSAVINVPIYYYPESPFSALRVDGVNWFRYLVCIWIAGVVVLAILSWARSRRRRKNGDEGSAAHILAVLNWYNPVYWLFERYIAREKKLRAGDVSLAGGLSPEEEKAARKKDNQKIALLLVMIVGMLISSTFLFEFRYAFQEPTDVLSLLGVPEKDFRDTDFVRDDISSGRLGVLDYYADSRYSDEDLVDFITWEYAGELSPDEVFAHIQPVVDKLNEVFGEAVEGDPGVSIYGGAAKKRLEWTGHTDEGEKLRFSLDFVPEACRERGKGLPDVMLELRMLPVD